MKHLHSSKNKVLLCLPCCRMYIPVYYRLVCHATNWTLSTHKHNCSFPTIGVILLYSTYFIKNQYMLNLQGHDMVLQIVLVTC